MALRLRWQHPSRDQNLFPGRFVPSPGRMSLWLVHFEIGPREPRSGLRARSARAADRLRLGIGRHRPGGFADVQSEKLLLDTNRAADEELRPLALRHRVDNQGNPIHAGAQHQPGIWLVLVRARRDAAAEPCAGRHHPAWTEEGRWAGEARNIVILPEREPGIDGQHAPELRLWSQATARRHQGFRRRLAPADN